jgi:hypothetical protein
MLIVVTSDAVTRGNTVTKTGVRPYFSRSLRNVKVLSVTNLLFCITGYAVRLPVIQLLYLLVFILIPLEGEIDDFHQIMQEDFLSGNQTEEDLQIGKCIS